MIFSSIILPKIITTQSKLKIVGWNLQFLLNAISHLAARKYHEQLSNDGQSDYFQFSLITLMNFLNWYANNYILIFFKNV